MRILIQDPEMRLDLEGGRGLVADTMKGWMPVVASRCGGGEGVERIA